MHNSHSSHTTFVYKMIFSITIYLLVRSLQNIWMYRFGFFFFHSPFSVHLETCLCSPTRELNFRKVVFFHSACRNQNGKTFNHLPQENWEWRAGKENFALTLSTIFLWMLSSDNINRCCASSTTRLRSELCRVYYGTKFACPDPIEHQSTD